MRKYLKIVSYLEKLWREVMENANIEFHWLKSADHATGLISQQFFQKVRSENSQINSQMIKEFHITSTLNMDKNNSDSALKIQNIN